jgi:hypothetical protein
VYHGSESVNVNARKANKGRAQEKASRTQRLYASLLEARTPDIFHDSAVTDQEWQTWRCDLEDFALRLFERLAS